jgi:glycosyltransferase involved in cell wall biosynthesis
VRILLAHSFYRIPGGEDGYVRQQAELLRERHTVELFERRNEELTGGVSTLRDMTYSLRTKTGMSSVIRQFRPDIIHLHNAYPSLGPAVHLAASKASVPLVMTVHNYRLRCPNGYMFTEGEPCRRCEGGMYPNAVLHECFPNRTQAAGYALALWTHRFIMKLDRRVGLYITPSEFMRERMLQWGFEGERVAVVRNFTDVFADSFEPGSYGLYLGRVSSEKGIDVLLRALKRAGDVPFKIAGDGPALGDLKKLAAELGLRNTEFLGRIATVQVPAALKGASFVALTSSWDENAPLAALEAMALARPLLVTATGGLPELVQNGEGVSCRVGDVEEIATRIRELAADAGRCRALGERALRRAKEEFAPQGHLARLEIAYDKALALSR